MKSHLINFHKAFSCEETNINICGCEEPCIHQWGKWNNSILLPLSSVLKNHRKVSIHHHLTKGNISVFHLSADPTVRMNWIQRRIHGKGGFYAALVCFCLVLFVSLVCDIAAIFGLYPKGDRVAQGSSFHWQYTSSPLSFPLSIRTQKLPDGEVPCSQIALLFCAKESFQVIDALVNLPVLIQPRLLSLCCFLPATPMAEATEELKLVPSLSIYEHSVLLLMTLEALTLLSLTG